MDAVCPHHPDAVAQAICERCGAFLCPDCALATDAGTLCVECLSRVQPGKPSGLAVSACVLGVAGLGCLFVPGVLGLILGYVEERRIAAGRADRGGAEWVKAAKLLGAVNLALGLASLVALGLLG